MNPLRWLHGEAMIRENPSFAFWSGRTTDDIVTSLLPNRTTSLKVKPDGTIVDGNTRAWILRERGYDVDALPREMHIPRPVEDFDDEPGRDE